MRFQCLDFIQQDIEEIGAVLGQAELVRWLDGRIRPRGGTAHQRIPANKWIVLFWHEAVAQPLKFEQLKWDANDITKPEGKWRFDALAETIRFDCAGCGHRIKDTPVDRRWIENHGRFVPTNPNAPKSRVSYTWNALLPHWIEWRAVIEEFLAAVDAMRIESDIEPMFTFVTESLGEPWDLDRWLVTSDDYVQQRKGDYDFGDPWPLEKTRFLAADRQARGGEHYFWVARAFGVGGASRLLAYGRCNTTSELEEVRKQLNVPVVNAMIDTGFKAAEVQLAAEHTNGPLAIPAVANAEQTTATLASASNEALDRCGSSKVYKPS